MKSRPKPVILLEALLAGQVVEAGGYRLAMSEDHKLCCVPLSGLSEGEGLAFDCDVAEFCRMAEGMSDDKVFLLAASKALGDVNAGGGPAKWSEGKRART